ncbi:Alpha-galactosidase [Capsicum baccatum]|uniref:Alpha-galactosidase n=1 Tax=Capsicum baccatum TaxID=33114 RepID=A0A2G2X907_CAPBA|nr:Alpha-galactosidase [Capsicum baccatum]
MRNNAMNALGHLQDMFSDSRIQLQPICSYSFGLYIHNFAMNTLGRPQDTFLDTDDCWAEPQCDDQRNFKAKNSTFPFGIKALADYVHSKGLKLGIYSDLGHYTCSKKMPGSLGHEEQGAKIFAAWASISLSRNLKN